RVEPLLDGARGLVGREHALVVGDDRFRDRVQLLRRHPLPACVRSRVSLPEGWCAETRRTVPERERMTIDSVSIASAPTRTPRRSGPPVTPVAATHTPAPRTQWPVAGLF